MDTIRTVVEKCSDPYQFYELRHPLERASPVIQSQLIRQPGIASKHTPFQRVVVEDSQDPVSLGESAIVAATYPRPFCMPTQESLMDSLTDDESTMTFASYTSYDHKQREANGNWQSLLDLETMKVPVVTSDFLSDIEWQFPEHETAARRRPAENPCENEQGGHVFRGGFRFGCSVLRHVHPSPILNSRPAIEGVAEEDEKTAGTLSGVSNNDEICHARKAGKRNRDNLRGALRRKRGVEKGRDGSRFREKLGMSTESGGGSLWCTDSIESTQEGEPSLKDTESLSTHTSKDWLTSSHVSELSLSLSKWRRIFNKTRRPVHHVARDVCSDRWNAN